MSCSLKKYFINTSGITVRLNQVIADPSLAPTFKFTINKPFIPIGWLTEDFNLIGQMPWPITPNAAAQFYPNLQELALSMALSNAGATPNTPGPAINGVVFTSGEYGGYMNQFLNSAQAPINENALIAAMTWFCDFWLTELTLFNAATALAPTVGLPPNSYPSPTYPLGTTSRIMQLCNFLTTLSDFRLWIPPGVYTCDGTNGTTDLNNIFNNPNIGNGTNLNMAILELTQMPG